LRRYTEGSILPTVRRATPVERWDAVAADAPRGVLGRAGHVGPIKPTLQAPGTKRLKLNRDKPLSKFAFNFNLRRYILGRGAHLDAAMQVGPGRYRHMTFKAKPQPEFILPKHILKDSLVKIIRAKLSTPSRRAKWLRFGLNVIGCTYFCFCTDVHRAPRRFTW